MPITLTDLLAAKEARQARQQRLRDQYKAPIVSMTINMPGPEKDSPVLRRLCDYAAAALQAMVPVLTMERLNLPTGPEALLAVSHDAAGLKQICINLEEQYAFSRLLDMDVFAADGSQLSRQQQQKSRLCLLCGQPAVICMRERKHSYHELQAAVLDLLQQFQAFETYAVSPLGAKLGSLAVEAMLYEAACTPAPGLVDRDNPGAHRDMDFFSFLSSSAALGPTMCRCAEAGIRHSGSLSELLPVLRHIGKEGEQAMLTATMGVNTQKGLIFSLGIIVAAAGWLTAQKEPLTAVAVLAAAAKIVEGIVARELSGLSTACSRRLTAGERLYQEYGIRGIRGELEDGLPAVRNHALPTLQQALAQGLSKNDALVQTLFVLMTIVEDTTVMNRHARTKLEQWVRPLAQEFLAQGGMYRTEGLQQAARLDKLFIEHNVSPGGAADLLAVTWFLHRLEEQFTPVK